MKTTIITLAAALMLGASYGAYAQEQDPNQRRTVIETIRKEEPDLVAWWLRRMTLAANEFIRRFVSAGRAIHPCASAGGEP